MATKLLNPSNDAGASGRHSHAAHGNEEFFVLFNNIYHVHFVKFW